MSPKRGSSYGAGSVHHRADGRWEGRVQVTDSLTGVRRRRTVYAPTRAEARAKVDKLRQAEFRSEPVAPDSLRLGDYLHEWLDTVVVHRVRPNTLANYRSYIERFLEPALGRRPLNSLTAREIRRYLDGLRTGGTGDRTVQYIHATLRVALADAVREEIIPKNVAALVRVPRPKRETREPLSIDEIRQLIAATEGDRLHTLYIVLAVLGLRRSELLGLKWEDLDLKASSLRIQRGLHWVGGKAELLPPKTARSRRTIPLPRLVLDALVRHRTEQGHEREVLGAKWPDHGLVFTTAVGTPLDPRNLTRTVQRASQRADVRVVRLHDFRHGCVSVLLSMGVPPRTVMEIVGHTTLDVTMNIYGHVTLDEARAAMDRLGRELRPNQH